MLLLISGLSLVTPTLTVERLPEQDFVGSNFPIADFRDPVTGATALDLPSVAYNSRRGQYLVVWHGFMGATGFNIYARAASADGGVSPTIVAVCEASRDQLQVSVAYDSRADQYWVVWEDRRSGTRGQIYARRLSSAGVPSGDEIVVDTNTGNGTRARLACGKDRCVIVWTEEENDETLEVYARAYDIAGSALSPPVRVSAAGSRASTPDVAYNGSADQYLVIWTEEHTLTGLDIKGQRLSSNLSPVGAPINVSVASGDQDRARIAYGRPSNRYCVVWQDKRSGTNWDVYVQILSSAGQLQGVSLPVYTESFDDGDPAIAAADNADEFLVSFGADKDSTKADYPFIHACTVTGAGAVSGAFDVRVLRINLGWGPVAAHRAGSDEYLVVWVDEYFVEGDIMAQRVGGGGNLVGFAFLVCAVRKGQESPRVAYNPQRDQYLVVWQDFRSGQDYDIYGRLLSAAGERLGQELVIATAGQLNGSPVVAYNSQRNEYLVVWDGILWQTGFDIHAQRVSATGQLLGGTILVSRDSLTSSEGTPRVAYNSTTGEYLVAWLALRSNSWDVCAQRFSGSGGLLGTILWLTTAGNQGAPRVAYNPQQNEYLVAWIEWDAEGELRARRISSTGTLVGGELVLVGPGLAARGRDLACDEATGEYLVVWGTEGGDIQGQRLNGTGGRLGSQFTIGTAGVDGGWPRVCYNRHAGEYTVVWEEFYEETDWDLYGARVSVSGSPVGGKFAVAIAPELQSGAALAANATSGEVLIVWQDFRNGSWDIFGQRYMPPVSAYRFPAR